MADVITQQCAGCGILKTAENNTAEKPWTRISGVSLGSSPQPIQVFRPTPPGQPRVQGMNWQALDFCVDCAAKTTVAQVPGLYSQKSTVQSPQSAVKPAAIPAAVAKPVAVGGTAALPGSTK